MNDIQNILVFILILFTMLMAFPKRGTVATRNFTMLLRAMFLGRMFQAITQYFKNKNEKV